MYRTGLVKVKKKGIFAVFLIFLCLLGCLGIVQLFIPVTRSEDYSLVVNEAYWLRLATNAWRYFQPHAALNPTTGLHGAGLGFPFFTDWDLGVQLQTIIDVNQLGILSNDGTWGADARFNKILTFLETRPLTSSGVPYVWYESATGNQKWSGQQNAADTGALLVALSNLRTLRPNLASSINYIVYNRTNYEPLKQAVDALTNSRNLYDYYAANGFASFWPDRFSALANSILNNIVSAPTVITYGATLPISQLTCEPLLLSAFNLAPNAKLQKLAKQVYLAHEARYNATGKFVAFSEGNTPFGDPDYVYEWVVREDGSTWVIEDTGQVQQAIAPMIYFKTAVGLLAMCDTAFTENMASYVESYLPEPAKGYADGIDENEQVNTNVIDKTNAMIIGAARYAINDISSPTPSPSASPSPSFSPPASPTPSPSSQVTLIMGVHGSGTATPSVGAHTYNVGAQVTISASAATDYTFSYWLFDDGTQNSDSSVTLTMSRDRSALAVFNPNTPPPSPTPTPSPIPTSPPSPTPTPSPSPDSTSPNPSASPSSSFSPPASPTPFQPPAGSAGSSLANPLEGLLVASVIVLLVVFCFSLFALRIIRHRKKNSAKSAIRCAQQFKRLTKAYAFF